MRLFAAALALTLSLAGCGPVESIDDFSQHPTPGAAS